MAMTNSAALSKDKTSANLAGVIPDERRTMSNREMFGSTNLRAKSKLSIAIASLATSKSMP